MKNLILSLTVLLASSTASLADGFVCDSPAGDLRVKAYNYVQPGFGTRNVAVMVFSDQRISVGRKTIARFTDLNGTVTNSSASYSANVDLRFNDSGRKGELIGGTKLGYLKTVYLDVDFSYSFPVARDAKMVGLLTLVKRNGAKIHLSLDCARYLKRG